MGISQMILNIVINAILSRWLNKLEFLRVKFFPALNSNHVTLKCCHYARNYLTRGKLATMSGGLWVLLAAYKRGLMFSLIACSPLHPDLTVMQTAQPWPLSAFHWEQASWSRCNPHGNLCHPFHYLKWRESFFRGFGTLLKLVANANILSYTH